MANGPHALHEPFPANGFTVPFAHATQSPFSSNENPGEHCQVVVEQTALSGHGKHADPSATDLNDDAEHGTHGYPSNPASQRQLEFIGAPELAVKLCGPQSTGTIVSNGQYLSLGHTLHSPLDPTYPALHLHAPTELDPATDVLFSLQAIPTELLNGQY
jgi:hypothetical protein